MKHDNPETRVLEIVLRDWQGCMQMGFAACKPVWDPKLIKN